MLNCSYTAGREEEVMGGKREIKSRDREYTYLATLAPSIVANGPVDTS